MAAIITILTPRIVEQYVDGDLNSEDRVLAESIIASDGKAKQIAVRYLWDKAGLSPKLLNPAGDSDG